MYTSNIIMWHIAVWFTCTLSKRERAVEETTNPLPCECWKPNLMTTASSVHEASTDAFIWSVQSPVTSSRAIVYRTPLPDQLASLTTRQTTKEENPVNFPCPSSSKSRSGTDWQTVRSLAFRRLGRICGGAALQTDQSGKRPEITQKYIAHV